MILGSYLKKLRRLKRKDKKPTKTPTFPEIPTIHLILPTPAHDEAGTAGTSNPNKMALSRTTTSSSTTEYTNGYHTSTSSSTSPPPGYTDHHHHHPGAVSDHGSSASRLEYARILYEHTMKQMERFAQDAQARGTVSIDHYQHQQRTAAIN
ncbi:hypothetical protein TWF718_008835 [Orbilia javanica]|uniref:Uncharacterized protein n=1 Tax=Orbilia javanica TaxID=47235 RepID=A0AAN8N156_9PEZI